MNHDTRNTDTLEHGTDKNFGITRRQFVKKAAVASSLSALSLAGAAEMSAASAHSPDEHRNVLLIISDDHGLADSGCYGNPVLKTPSLDSLAKKGVRFSSAFSTVASCSASRSVIFTGLFNHTNGQYGHQHGPANLHTQRWVRGLPAMLNEQGYHTGLIGKFHVQPRQVYPFQELITSDVGYKSVKALQGNRDVWSMARQAGEFFSSEPEKPFFLTVAYSDPHRDWVKSNAIDYPNVKKETYDPEEVILPPYLPDKPEVRRELAAYYQSVGRLDQGIGFLLEALEKSGRAGNTLIIYISDNGIAFPGAKTNLYDPGIRLPMIISSPTQRRHGLVNDSMVSYIDIAPTVLDWAGAGLPPYELPGRSILPVLEQENPAGWDTVFASHTFHEITMYYPMRVIRTRKYKYILNLAHGLEFPFASDLYESATWQGILRRGDGKMGVREVEKYIHRPKEELYELENDPHEVANVADDPQYKDVLDDLRVRLRSWQEATDDPWIVKYSYE